MNRTHVLNPVTDRHERSTTFSISQESIIAEDLENQAEHRASVHSWHQRRREQLKAERISRMNAIEGDDFWTRYFARKEEDAYV